MTRRDSYDRITRAEIRADQTLHQVKSDAEIDQLLQENRYLLFGKIPSLGRYFFFAENQEEIDCMTPSFEGEPEIHDLDMDPNYREQSDLPCCWFCKHRQGEDCNRLGIVVEPADICDLFRHKFQ